MVAGPADQQLRLEHHVPVLVRVLADLLQQQFRRRPAELLLDEARGADHRHEQLLFEPQLVVRESSMVRRPDGRKGKP